jgi:hypothetical protein
MLEYVVKYILSLVNIWHLEPSANDKFDQIYGVVTLNLKTLSIMTLSVQKSKTTLRIDNTQHNDMKYIGIQ